MPTKPGPEAQKRAALKHNGCGPVNVVLAESWWAHSKRVELLDFEHADYAFPRDLSMSACTSRYGFQNQSERVEPSLSKTRNSRHAEKIAQPEPPP